MIKVVNSFLNIRTGTPDTNTAATSFLEPGDTVTVVEIIRGLMIEGNNIWYRDDKNRFFWSGGFDQSISDSILWASNADPLARLINYNTLIEGVPESLQKSGGRNVTVGVLDAGIFEGHPDLAARTASADSRDFTGSSFMFQDKTLEGHGTHIAGLIGGNSISAKGIKGIAPECDLRVYKVLRDSGASSSNFLVSCFNHILTSGPIPDILNMSLNLTFKDFKNNAQITPLLDQLTQKTICVAAAGNNEELLQQTNQLFVPARHDGCISVGSIDADFFFSNKNAQFNPRLDFIIPKIDFTSSSNSEQMLYRKLSGSSMATAIVTGIIALMLSNDPGLKDVNRVKVELAKLAKPYKSINSLNSFNLIKP